MASSLTYQQANENKRKLLKSLIPRVVAPRELGEDAFERALANATEHLVNHTFLDTYPKNIDNHYQSIEAEFSRHSQQRKMAALQQLTSRFHALSEDHPESEQGYKTLALLLDLAREPLKSHLNPATIHAAIQIQGTSQHTVCRPEYATSSSGGENAARNAWDEDDALSDWDDPQEDYMDRSHALPPLPFRKSTSVSPGWGSPNHVIEPPNSVPPPAFEPTLIQYPALELPGPATMMPLTLQHQRGDMVAAVAELRGNRVSMALAQSNRCFSTLLVARQCLELLEGRPGVIFQAEPSPHSFQKCLSRLEPPTRARFLVNSHSHDTTPSALSHFVQPYLVGADQKLVMTSWIEAISSTAGYGSKRMPLPESVLAPDGTVCSSVSAFVVAIGQQLDMVSAATQAIQDRLQHLEAGDIHLLGGMLLWMDAMCRPILRRIARLHSMFVRPLNDAFEMVSRVQWDLKQVKQSKAAGDTDVSKSIDPLGLVCAGMTKALVDALHDMLIETECLGARHGRTQRGMLLHLMLATLCPTLEGIDFMLKEGKLYDNHYHMFLRYDSSVDTRSQEFWQSSCTLCTSGGLQLAPRCLSSVARRIVSAGKAVAVLHMHERIDRSQAWYGDSAPVIADLMPRVIHQLDQMVLSASEWAGDAPRHECSLLTALMAASGELLAVMHQPDESAEETLLYMIEALDAGDDENNPETNPAHTGGYAGPAGTVPVPSLSSFMQPVGVLEKVEWMQGGTQEPSLLSAGTLMDVNISEQQHLPVAESGTLADIVQGINSGAQYGVSRVSADLEALGIMSQPCTRLQSPSPFGGEAVGNPSVQSVQGSFAHLIHTLPTGVFGPGSVGLSDGEREVFGGGVDKGSESEGASESSSDFSYGSSSGDESDEDVEERKILREARKALQAGRRLAWKDKMNKQRSGNLNTPDAQNLECATSLDTAYMEPRSPRQQADQILVEAANAGIPVPPVEDPEGKLPEWAEGTSRQLQAASDKIRSASAYLEYATSYGRTRLVHKVLPGGTSMPAFLPVHGSQVVGERMANANSQHLHQDETAEPTTSKQNDALWLQHVEAEMLPPMDSVVQLCLVATLQARTKTVGLELSRHLLGIWSLRSELRRVRGVMLMASQAMRTWADTLCNSLNRGTDFSDAEASKVELHDLEQQFHAQLDAAHAMDPAEPDSQSVHLTRRELNSKVDSNRLGLGNARSPSIQRSQLSQAAYIDTVYNVTWPLSIVISPHDLQRYRQCLPVLLQLHWVRRNLAYTSKALWSARHEKSDPFFLPISQKASSSTPSRSSSNTSPPPKPNSAPKLLTAASVTDALQNMHHVVGTFQRIPLEALASEWTSLESALSGKGSVDLDDICSLHTRYLDRVQEVCLLGMDRPSQVVAHSLYQILEIALQFTQSVMSVLNPGAGWESDAQAVDKRPKTQRANRGHKRAAASKAARLSIKFKQEVHHVVTLLCNPHLSTLAGNSTAYLLSMLNFNGHYNKVIAQERQRS